MLDVIGQGSSSIVTYFISLMVLLIFISDNVNVNGAKKMFLMALSFVPYLNFVASIIVGALLFIDIVKK